MLKQLNICKMATQYYFSMSKDFTALLLFYIMQIICLVVSSGEASVPFPPREEVEALREIGKQLGKGDWNFDINPCDNNTNWVSPLRSDVPKYNNTVWCNCTIDANCHVTHIILKLQDLAGVLPPSLAKLPYIKYIDLSNNYLNGTIPREWASIKLEFMSLSLNRLSGPIPDFVGNISTLTYMSLETNMFSGHLPASLGNLTNLGLLVLSTNNLSGTLPRELSRLTKLIELRFSSNNFTGPLPIFEEWTNLQKLEIQGSGFHGPIPSSVSSLTTLIELRISDLEGASSGFPNLEKLVFMTRLMLRSCNISAMIPLYILALPQLQMLDLSFNNLYGGIPELGGANTKLEYAYFTSNNLTGSIPKWTEEQSRKFDLSYNNFSNISFSPNCVAGIPNLFRSFNERNLGSNRCLQPCPNKKSYSFHINCGGKELTIGKTKYEADDDAGGIDKFVRANEYWGSSRTGHYWDAEKFEDMRKNNISMLQMDNTELYTTARVSPLSLTYYGRCLANGVYTVKLHFAEITFSNNKSFKSLGRRIFDIYIQDELIRKNFNIEHEAGGLNKEVIKEFKADVKNTILDIRFQWTSLGTAAVPDRKNFGPLISAISVKSDFDPPLNVRKIILIVATVASSCLVLIVLYIFWWKGYFKCKNSSQQDWKALDLQIGFFSLKQIRAATSNFHDENKIGQGGFGSVYKGVLSDGTRVAIKQLSSTSKQGNKEFMNEVGMISCLQHPNLVKLYGCCVEGRQLLLIYEYMENNSLANALFGPEQYQLRIDWPTRHRICVGIARGLAFLHEESTFKVVHRDIKATNVLLDGELNAKISDFGLAKLDEEENTHISTRVAGTIGYMAPEYALWGYLTHKADVYSFGIVVLETVAGKSNMKFRPEGKYVCLLDKALVLQQKGNILELVDPKLGSDYNTEEAIRMIKVALLCTNPSPAIRPAMSAVVSMLEGEISVQEPQVDPSDYSDELKLKALRDKYNELNMKNTSDKESIAFMSESTNYGSSSTSGKDLNSVNLYSE